MRLTARLIVLGVMLSVGIGPVVLDICVLSCEASADNSRVESTAACHHSHSRVGTHLKASLAGCGHDHHFLAATTTPFRAFRDLNGVGASSALATAPLIDAAVSVTVGVAPRERSHCPEPDALRLTPLRV